jgi:hypothetical protein
LFFLCSYLFMQTLPPQTPARRVRADGWTLDAQLAFIDALAEGGCVRQACLAAGRSHASAYAQRTRNPAFREAWEAALDLGYQQLRSMAMDRLRDGCEHRVYDADDNLISRKTVFSDRLLMFLIDHTRPRVHEFSGPQALMPDNFFDTFEDRFAKAIDGLSHGAAASALLSPPPSPSPPPSRPATLPPGMKTLAEQAETMTDAQIMRLHARLARQRARRKAG